MGASCETKPAAPRKSLPSSPQGLKLFPSSPQPTVPWVTMKASSPLPKGVTMTTWQPPYHIKTRQKGNPADHLGGGGVLPPGPLRPFVPQDILPPFQVLPLVMWLKPGASSALPPMLSALAVLSARAGHYSPYPRGNFLKLGSCADYGLGQAKRPDEKMCEPSIFGLPLGTDSC